MEKELRECQRVAVEEILASLEAGSRWILVPMATGAGKTFTAATVASRLLKSGMGRILFLADTRALAAQAYREFEAYPVPVQRIDGAAGRELRFSCANTLKGTRNAGALRKPRKAGDMFASETVSTCLTENVQEPLQTCSWSNHLARVACALQGAEGNPQCWLRKESACLSAVDVCTIQKMWHMLFKRERPEWPRDRYDLIIVDECHRSIYGEYGKVLAWFEAPVIGLTATPDERTLEYFHYNVVGEYSIAQAIADKVNVPARIYVINTQISREGAYLEQQIVEKRDPISRKTYEEMLEEDLFYRPNALNRTVVNRSQLELVLKTFQNSLFSTLFPGRKEVPKTLIFAKNDVHADDVVEITRKIFAKTLEKEALSFENGAFCRKITSRASDAEEALEAFRHDYLPRIAVTVDMIATGIDVKAIECLLFLRNVKSRTYYEQMRGRGTRTLALEELQQVTPSATEEKKHYVIVDAAGVVDSRKWEITGKGKRKLVALAPEHPQQVMDDVNEDSLVWTGFVEEVDLSGDAGGVAGWQNKTDENADVEERVGRQPRRKYKRRKRYLAPNIEEMERLSRELAEYNAENGMSLAEKEAIRLGK